jgi:ATP-dependent DNA helicase RecQ
MTDSYTHRQPPPIATVIERCLSIDLEVGLRDSRLHSFAAVRGDTGASLHHKKGDLAAALRELDAFTTVAACTFLLGHNLIDFDLPHLTAAHPGLLLLKLPAIDTLRLNPLAFPRNPYHHLVKHYQDGKLQRGSVNDPDLDARLTLDLFADQLSALASMLDKTPNLLLAWHWLTTLAPFDATGLSTAGFDAVFTCARRAARPDAVEAAHAIRLCLQEQTCQTHAREILAHTAQHAWPLAYALAWLSVCGGNSVLPPWVNHQFPQVGILLRRLRDASCQDPACTWCSERHNAGKELKRWFGFDNFRPLPADANGLPLQQAIVEAALQGKHVLGILPTGTGKSLCYQVPALSRYDKTGALTVVISPLVALMADQVAGLEARGITCCTSLNGLLSMPERADVLDRVRLGDAGILIISPEQLRSRALRKVLAQREIGAWVLDEAHCISKWGHDFRPDYRYVGRFIKEHAAASAAQGVVPPVLCLTATAKPDVVADMRDYFRERVGIDLMMFDGGAERNNLDFVVVPTTRAEKLAHIHQLLEADLAPDSTSGAIVYCASRKQTEEVAKFLSEKGLPAEHFHAGLPPERKKTTQQRFIQGELRVIAATNAFGMGIDKPDVRLVIHADMPGSLENYLQEAGRAGRDQSSARCVLLYTAEDVEWQFSMSARSRLTQREIQAILRSLKALERKGKGKGQDGEAGVVVATAGEMLVEDTDGHFQRDSATDDTRVRTAIAWLEESHLLTREENMVQVFPSSLRVSSVAEAEKRLAKADLFAEYRRQLLSLIQTLIQADPDEGVSTDELMGVSGLSSSKVRAALYDLEALGLASNDTGVTAYVHAGIERSSRKRQEQAAALEIALIDLLRENAPDMAKGDQSLLHLRHASQRLKDAGHADALPEKLSRIVHSLAFDGRSEDGGIGSLRLKRLDAETVQVTLQREWSALAKTAQLRRTAANLLLEHWLAVLPPGVRGADLLAVTTQGKLHAALTEDLALSADVKDSAKLLDRALLWLHEQEVIRLNKGLAVFRPAMTIHLGNEKRGFAKADFAPLQLHYEQQVVQIHVMAEYVQRGLQRMADAVQLAIEYFRLERAEFMQRWLPERDKDLTRQTTPASWRAIVENLNNVHQQRIVTDERDTTNTLVLAGPGSGKTRVLVHRIAYLVRVRRENPHGILALAYNRHAAVEIRRRLSALIGDDARGVTVLTCHALAMRLAGASFSGKRVVKDDDAFAEVMRQALALLKGEGLPPEEADEQRQRLLGSFRWILVDEYQDIGPDQYELISALAGRTRAEDDGRLTLFAVGDDDQNIYAFDGASVEFIRRFETDYAAKAVFLVENFRSTHHIIECANQLIAPANNRMKLEHPIKPDAARSKGKRGGAWQQRDPVGQGRVQILPAGRNACTQTMAVMAELTRLAGLDADWDWANAAVIARQWHLLEPVRSYCELHGIPVQMADDDGVPVWRLRETQALIDWLRGPGGPKPALIDTAALADWLADKAGVWWDLLRDAVTEYALETTGAELPVAHFIEWLAEWGREVRKRQSGLLLTTAHRAKGLEFDHVAVLDGAWDKVDDNEDRDAPRRLFYVAMTRARQTLLLARMDGGHALLDALPDMTSLLRREAVQLPPPDGRLQRRYLRLGLGEVFIGYAGGRDVSDPVHGAIAALTAGDALQLRPRPGASGWELLDGNGMVVGRLAGTFAMPGGMHCIAARVAAVMVWRREDSEAEYQDRLRCERWEVVLPELVLAQADEAARG